MKNSIYYKRISACESGSKTKSEQSEVLLKQISQFQRSGGEIKSVPTGVSGNPDFGVHHNNATKAKRREA